MASKRKKTKRISQTARNWFAVAAHFATGAGSHGDRRKHRQKTRSAQKRTALTDFG